MDDTDLRDLYKRLCDAPSDIRDHLPRLVEIAVDVDASHIIELGVRHGVSTIAWLYAVAVTGGRLTSIDCSAPPFLDAPRWTFLFADDLHPNTVAAMEPCDVLFIDTVHTLEHTRAELAAYGPLVRQGGRIVLHDTMLAIDEDQPVLRAMSEYADARGYEWTNNPRCGGLGEIWT